MTKAELIDIVSEKAGITKTAARKAVEGCIHGITDALVRGETVRIQEFGTFEIKDRAARTGKNPRTGDRVHIPETRIPAFRASELLKKKVEKNLTIS